MTLITDKATAMSGCMYALLLQEGLSQPLSGLCGSERESALVSRVCAAQVVLDWKGSWLMALWRDALDLYMLFALTSRILPIKSCYDIHFAPLRRSANAMVAAGYYAWFFRWLLGSESTNGEGAGRRVSRAWSARTAWRRLSSRASSSSSASRR